MVIAMNRKTSKYRLRSNVFERQDESIKVEPKRMIILSVEGDETERNYFQHLNSHLDSTIIQIEILRHKRGDGYSDPLHVIELLNEYIDVRDGKIIPDELPQPFADKYPIEILNSYLTEKEKLDIKLQKEIEEDLLQIGIDIEYRRYLNTFDKDTDYFAVVLDRDRGNHSAELMSNCLKICNDRHYGYYITNPCFEFWLLLHLCDVKKTYSDEQLTEIYNNEKVSKQHTFVSKEVSNIAKHNKKISSKTFDEYYLPNIYIAIENSSQFKSEFPELFDDLGTNLVGLYEILGFTQTN